MTWNNFFRSALLHEEVWLHSRWRGLHLALAGSWEAGSRVNKCFSAENKAQKAVVWRTMAAP